MLRRRTRALPVLALTAAVLLAGCSSSPDAAKLVAGVAPLASPTTPPAHTEPPRASAPGTASEELTDSPSADWAPVITPWVPRRRIPPRDELADVDTSDASAEQAAEIDDRDVTLEEYEAAFGRFRECLAAAGFELGAGYFHEDRYHYTVPSEAVEDGADEECYRSELYYVDMLWQLRGPGLSTPD